MTLYVYGDSFASNQDRFPGWAELLKTQLGVELVNRAISGSSTEFSIKKFLRDLAANVWGRNDIVIFVTSTPGRLHLNFQNNIRPDSAAGYMHDVHKVAGRDDSWYFQNKSHIEWLLVNQDSKLLAINHEAYVHLIKSIAWSRPDITFIVLANSDHEFHTIGVENPPNFLTSTTYLNVISTREYINPDHNYRNWVAHTRWDLRLNHLSNTNLKILCQLLLDAIQKKDLSNFTYEQFNSRFLDPVYTKSQYDRYIQDDYIPDMYSLKWFADSVPKLIDG
jgi:hypothetical protein